VRTPVYRGELHEGGAALTGRAIHLLAPEDPTSLSSNPTAQPARAPCARRSRSGVLEVEARVSGSSASQHAHQRSQRQPGRRDEAAECRDQRPDVGAQHGRDDGGQAEHGEGAPDPDARALAPHE